MRTSFIGLTCKKNILNILAKTAAENVERLDAASSKDRLETWKYAAEEIVDLLKTIRQEGEGGTVNHAHFQEDHEGEILIPFSRPKFCLNPSSPTH